MINSKGMSLIQVMVLIAVLGSTTAGLMKIVNLQNSLARYNEARYDIESLKENIQKYLINPRNCTATFSNYDSTTELRTIPDFVAAPLTQLSAGDENYAKSGDVAFTVNSNFRNSLIISEYIIQDDDAGSDNIIVTGSKVNAINLIVKLELTDPKKDKLRISGSEFLIPIQILTLFDDSGNFQACFAQKTSGSETDNVVYGISERMCNDLSRAVSQNETQQDSDLDHGEGITNATHFDNGACVNVPQIYANAVVQNLCGSQMAPTSHTSPANRAAIPVRNIDRSGYDLPDYFVCIHRYQNFTCNPSDYPQFADPGRPSDVNNLFLKEFDRDGNPVCGCQPRECPSSSYICATDHVGTDWCGNYCTNASSFDSTTNLNSPIVPIRTDDGLGTDIDYGDEFNCHGDERDIQIVTSRDADGNPLTFSDETILFGSSGSRFCGLVPQVCPTEAEKDQICQKLVKGESAEYLRWPSDNGCGFCAPFEARKNTDGECIFNFTCPVPDDQKDQVCKDMPVKGDGGICNIGSFRGTTYKHSSGDSWSRRYCGDNTASVGNQAQWINDRKGNTCNQDPKEWTTGNMTGQKGTWTYNSANFCSDISISAQSGQVCGAGTNNTCCSKSSTPDECRSGDRFACDDDTSFTSIWGTSVKTKHLRTMQDTGQSCGNCESQQPDKTQCTSVGQVITGDTCEYDWCPDISSCPAISYTCTSADLPAAACKVDGEACGGASGECCHALKCESGSCVTPTCAPAMQECSAEVPCCGAMWGWTCSVAGTCQSR